MIEGTQLDEILLVDTLAKLLSGTQKEVLVIDKETGKEVAIKVNTLAADMFQCLRLNREIPKNKILLHKDVPPRPSDGDSS